MLPQIQVDFIRSQISPRVPTGSAPREDRPMSVNGMKAPTKADAQAEIVGSIAWLIPMKKANGALFRYHKMKKRISIFTLPEEVIFQGTFQELWRVFHIRCGWRVMSNIRARRLYGYRICSNWMIIIFTTLI